MAGLKAGWAFLAAGLLLCIDAFFIAGSNRGGSSNQYASVGQVLNNDAFQLTAEARVRTKHRNGGSSSSSSSRNAAQTHGGGGGGGGTSSSSSSSAPSSSSSSAAASSSPYNTHTNSVATWRSINTALEQKDNAEEILALIDEKIDAFNIVNCATAINRLSRFAFEQRNSQSVIADRRFNFLMNQIYHQLDSSGPGQQNQFLSAFARLGFIPEEAVLDRLLKRIEVKVNAYACREIAGLTNAMARLSVTTTPRNHHSHHHQRGVQWPQSLLGMLRDRAIVVLQEGSAPIISNVYCSICKLGYPPGQELTTTLAEQLILLDLKSLDSHWLAQVVSSISRASVDPGADFLSAARDETLRRMNTMNPLDLAMVTSSLAKMRHVYNPGDLFFFSVTEHMSKRLPRFAGTQTLSLITNGLGNLVHPSRGASEDFVSSLLGLAAASLPAFKPQELAHVLGGLGKLKARPNAAFLAATSELVMSRMNGFTPADLSNTVFGLIRMRYQPNQAFMESVRHYCSIKLEEEGRGRAHSNEGRDPRDMAHLLQTYVRLGMKPEEEVMKRLAGALDGQLAKTSSESLSMIVVGMAKFQYHPGNRFLADVAQVGLGGAAASASPESALHIALLIHGLNRLGFEPSRQQVDHALDRLSSRLHELTPKCLFNLLWSLAKWAHPCAETESGRIFLDRFTGQATEVLEGLTTSQLVVTAWALHQLGYQAPLKVQTTFRQLVEERPPAAITDGEAASLLHSLAGIGIDTSDYPSILLLRGRRVNNNNSNSNGRGGRGRRAVAGLGGNGGGKGEALVAGRRRRRSSSASRLPRIESEEEEEEEEKQEEQEEPFLYEEGYVGSPGNNVSSLSRGSLL